MSRFKRIDSIVEAVGNTPLVRLRSIERDNPGVKIYLKLEYMNPGGSVKDRPALNMMRDAIADGRLTKERTLIDATSGNTGVAYSLFGACLGYKVALVMPSNVSQARKSITGAFGTELIYSDPMEGSDGAIRLCRKLVEQFPGKYFYSDQYSNPSNPGAHYLGTGREILEQLGDEITHFVAGLGTSGTMMGTTRRLREHHRKILCVAAEPAEALHGLEDNPAHQQQHRQPVDEGCQRFGAAKAKRVARRRRAFRDHLRHQGQAKRRSIRHHVARIRDQGQ